MNETLSVAEIDALTGRDRAKPLAMARGFHVVHNAAICRDFMLKRGNGDYVYAVKETEQEAYAAAFDGFNSDEELALVLIQEGHQFGQFVLSSFGLMLCKCRFGEYRESPLDTYPVAIMRAFLYAAHGHRADTTQKSEVPE